ATSAKASRARGNRRGRRPLPAAPGARRPSITSVSYPDLEDVVERRLRVEEVDALQADIQGADAVANERVAVAAAEVAHGVAPQLHHVEARSRLDRRARRRLDRDMADEVA